MKFLHLPFTALFILFSYLSVNAQSPCFNADFEDNSFTNWTGATGSCCPLNTSNPGLQIGGNHQIMVGPGNDPAVAACTNLSIVAPGSNFSAMVGDGQGTGGQAARLQYTFNITPQSNMIIVQYAVVLQDAGHSVAQQPRFEAQLYDASGNPIPCTFYQVAAANGVPGFQTCGGVTYKDWTTFGVDVTQFLGQTVTLDIATGDCSLGGHYGYAYVDASCTSLNLSALYCQNGANNTATLQAPSGFANYVWTNAANGQQLATGQVASVNIAGVDTVNCTITSVNGCVATLTTAVLPAEVIGSIVDSNVCAGNSTLLFNTTSFQNSSVDSCHWTSSDGYTDTTFNFNHTFPGPGQYTIELIVQNTANCVDTVTTVIDVFENPVAGFGFNDVCLGQIATFNASSSLLGGDTITNYWYVNNDTLVGDTVTVNFNGPNVYQVDLIALTENGCADTVSQSFTVFNNPTANFSITESCIDQAVQFNNTSASLSNSTTFEWVYNNTLLDTSMDLSYVFNTPGLQNISLITTDSFSAAVQCDDTITLSFFVHDLPVFTYLADTIQCEDVGFVINGFPTVSTNEPLSYTWEIDGILDDTTVNLSTVIANPGIHPITYTVTSAFGCETDTTFDMYVMATPLPPVLSFNIPECPGDPFFLTATGEPNSTIAWSGPNNFNSNLFNVTFPLGVDGMGIYTAFLTSEYGCISDTTQIDATITYTLSFNDFDFPNVISANDDNTNDFLDLKSYFQTCDEFTLYIFNRWGNMVWEQSQDSPFFRGVDKGGKALEAGVYTYKLVFENYEKQGFIHVVR
ncbi:MAG: hypothetical protein EBR91_03555 [Flavobacteriia bacterium]|nr:hypothetical protein [Flavobacteriia bacterium]